MGSIGAKSIDITDEKFENLGNSIKGLVNVEIGIKNGVSIRMS